MLSQTSLDTVDGTLQNTSPKFPGHAKVPIPKVLHNFDVLDKLGVGAFATVYRVVDKITKQAYALKKIDVQHDIAYKEYAMLKGLKHENVLKVFGIFESTEHACLQMQLICGGDLFHQIDPNSCGLAEELARKYMLQLAKGLEYIHYNGIVHSDIKPENVLVDKDHIVICDFGLAQMMDTESTGKARGTESYMAPELLNRLHQNPYSSQPPQDTWAFGIVLYAVLFADLPWDRSKPSDPDFAYFCQKGGVTKNVHPFQYISPNMRKLLRSTLHLVARKRPSMSAIINFITQDNTPWFYTDRTTLDIEYGLRDILPEDFENMYERNM